MKDRKYIYMIVILTLVVLVLGLSYAWFNAVITGNDTAKKNTVVTGDLKLTYTDTNEMSLSNAFPGDSFEKVISVKNDGTVNLNYNLIWQELNNGITNNELVIEATCKRLNSSNTEEGTCEGISESAVNSVIIKNGILIEPKVTHEYTLKVTFKDTGLVQDYNKNKTFTGKLGIEEYIPTQFEKDSWTTIATNVKNGNIDNYKVGDTRKVDIGSYGIHTLRIANASTPSECSTSGFSQTACGFVLEFADIITTYNMNPRGTYNGTTYNYGWNKDGWPASSMYTFVNNDIYNALPSDLKSVIIDTTVVSSHGSEDTANFTSTDKLYLLASGEVWSDWKTSSGASYDAAKDLTRTLDYYTAQGVTTSNCSGAIKKNESNASRWWLRSASSSNQIMFSSIDSVGCQQGAASVFALGVAPAFRIG